MEGTFQSRDGFIGSPAWGRKAAGAVLRCALVALAASVLAGCMSVPSAPPPAPSAARYQVGPPDQLTIAILPDPEITRVVTVRPDGMISVDLIGDVPAAGRTTEEIAQDIERRIGRYKRDASVTVALSAALSTQVTVLGEVARPGTFPLSRRTRLIEAIGHVGGPARFAAKDRVRIVRIVDGKPSVFIASLAAIMRGDLKTNLLLEGGDIIVVPPTAIASVGYGVQSLLFPLQQLLGFGASVTTTVVSGGTL